MLQAGTSILTKVTRRDFLNWNLHSAKTLLLAGGLINSSSWSLAKLVAGALNQVSSRFPIKILAMWPVMTLVTHWSSKGSYKSLGLRENCGRNQAGPEERSICKPRRALGQSLQEKLKASGVSRTRRSQNGIYYFISPMTFTFLWNKNCCNSNTICFSPMGRTTSHHSFPYPYIS